MGEAANKLKKLISAGDDDSLVKALGTAEDIYGTMSGIYGYYGAAKDILGKLGFLGKPADPLEEITSLLKVIRETLDEILGKLQEIEAKISAGSKLTTFQLIEDKFVSVKTAFDNAVDLIEHPNNSSIQYEYDDSLGGSWWALNAVTTPDMYYWQRLPAADGLYSDDWTPPLYPDDTNPDSAYIWDYRWLLPRLLQSLQRHIFVVSANTPDYQNAKIDNLQEYGEFLLNNIYRKILDGFAHIRRPDAAEFKYVIFASDPANFSWYKTPTSDFPGGHLDVQKERHTDQSIHWLRENRVPGGLWIKANYVFGSVERYSGYDCSAPYPSIELKSMMPVIAFNLPTENEAWRINGWPNFWWLKVKNTITVKPEFQRSYDRFCMRHTLRTLRKRNQLYNELGLPKLYQTIRHYFSILNLPLPIPPTPTDANPNANRLTGLNIQFSSWSGLNLQFTSWSVREVYQEVRRCITDNPPPEAPISLRVMAAMLDPIQAAIAAISLRRLCLLDEEFVSQ